VHSGGIILTRLDDNGVQIPFTKYDPMNSRRGGFGMCGDHRGESKFMRYGEFANPPSMPYVETYQPGGIMNLEYDFTANHGGYLEVYVCDVSNMPRNDISFDGFKENCHYLERVAHPSCESGNDKDCGPIDPAHTGKWIVPCRWGPGDQGDQVIGGDKGAVNGVGKMAYRLPNVAIEDGVVQVYWITANTCCPKMMRTYNYPSAWSGCSGDGGSVGSNPSHHPDCDSPGKFPEEFWNCADVQILGAVKPGGLVVNNSSAISTSTSSASTSVASDTGGSTASPSSSSTMLSGEAGNNGGINAGSDGSTEGPTSSDTVYTGDVGNSDGNNSGNGGSVEGGNDNGSTSGSGVSSEGSSPSNPAPSGDGGNYGGNNGSNGGSTESPSSSSPAYSGDGGNYDGNNGGNGASTEGPSSSSPADSGDGYNYGDNGGSSGGSTEGPSSSSPAYFDDGSNGGNTDGGKDGDFDGDHDGESNGGNEGHSDEVSDGSKKPCAEGYAAPTPEGYVQSEPEIPGAEGPPSQQTDRPCIGDFQGCKMGQDSCCGNGFMCTNEYGTPKYGTYEMCWKAQN
jgi:Lytic polysaccharide mono-oxygenase, cellulose-degrading